MHVVESSEITKSLALVIRQGQPVLVVQAGLLASADFRLLRSLLGCVLATVDPSLTDICR